tara:strand:- start:774 stop:1022 length:249 start_codon:yes stop_codon:yes gene_type:complete
MARKVTYKINPDSIEEALSDVGIGFMLSFPVGLVVLSITTFLGFGVTVTAFIQTIVFTVISFVRKYVVREYYRINKDPKNLQ